MKKVVVPQKSGHTFETAEEFGEIVELLGGRINPFNVDKLREQVRDRMTELCVTKEDYLLFCGQGVINALLLHEWLSAFGIVELLLFHAKEGTYVHRTLKA